MNYDWCIDCNKRGICTLYYAAQPRFKAKWKMGNNAIVRLSGGCWPDRECGLRMIFISLPLNGPTGRQKD